jgi:hypothetical protein
MDQMTLHSSQLFDADPASAAIVRRYVRESLDSLCLGSDEAVLLANELATNAILHAQSEFVVEVSVRERTCRIGVVDHDQRRPDKIEEVDHDATRGRGLARTARPSGATSPSPPSKYRSDRRRAASGGPKAGCARGETHGQRHFLIPLWTRLLFVVHSLCTLMFYVPLPDQSEGSRFGYGDLPVRDKCLSNGRCNGGRPSWRA